MGRGFALVAVVAMAILMLPAAASAQTEDSVTGSWEIPPRFVLVFDARSGPSGESPRGTVISINVGTETTGAVTCLAVSGHRAVIGVQVGGAGSPSFFTFAVEDNNGAGADRASFRVDASPPTCSEDPMILLDPFGPIETGDIHVVDAQPDNSAPLLTVPVTVSVNATSPAGARVTYIATATDNVDVDPEVVCTPASGSIFAIGTTTVTCTATDDAGNTTTKSFNVVVRLPTNKAECKDGGWRNFGKVFKNQGDCVSFVATRGKNPPGGSP